MAQKVSNRVSKLEQGVENLLQGLHGNVSEKLSALDHAVNLASIEAQRVIALHKVSRMLEITVADLDAETVSEYPDYIMLSLRSVEDDGCYVFRISDSTLHVVTRKKNVSTFVAGLESYKTTEEESELCDTMGETKISAQPDSQRVDKKEHHGNSQIDD